MNSRRFIGLPKAKASRTQFSRSGPYSPFSSMRMKRPSRSSQIVERYRAAEIAAHGSLRLIGPASPAEAACQSASRSHAKVSGPQTPRNPMRIRPTWFFQNDICRFESSHPSQAGGLWNSVRCSISTNTALMLVSGNSGLKMRPRVVGQFSNLLYA